MDQLSFFQEEKKESIKVNAPLAERMRPASPEEFVGQTHLLGPGKILDRLLKYKKLHSLILWGPPGCGKNHSGRTYNSQHKKPLNFSFSSKFRYKRYSFCSKRSKKKFCFKKTENMAFYG